MPLFVHNKEIIFEGTSDFLLTHRHSHLPFPWVPSLEGTFWLVCMISRTKSPVISLQKSGRSAKNNIFVKGVVGLEIFLLFFGHLPGDNNTRLFCIVEN